MLNAILHVAEHGCQWRSLPKHFGNWHTIYTRMNRGSKNGVPNRVFEPLQREQIVQIKIEAFGLDSTRIKVHPDGTGARTAVAFTLSPGHIHDAPEGRQHLNRLEAPSGRPALVMDRACETMKSANGRLTGVSLPWFHPGGTGWLPGRTTGNGTGGAMKWSVCSRRLKGFWRVFSRFDKLDVMFFGFIVLVLIIEALR